MTVNAAQSSFARKREYGAGGGACPGSLPVRG
jgi:hypothetical protein